MSLFVPKYVLSATLPRAGAGQAVHRRPGRRWSSPTLGHRHLLRHLSDLAHDAGDAQDGQHHRCGLGLPRWEDTEIPHFEAAQEMLISYLPDIVIDGWIYVKRGG